MNDEEISLHPTLETHLPEGDPPAEDAKACAEPCAEATSVSEQEIMEAPVSLEEVDDETDEAACDILEDTVEDPVVLEDPLSDLHSDPEASAEQDEGLGLDELRSELKQLRQQLNARDAFWERIGSEFREFGELYPEISPDAIPDSIWEQVRRGIPLAAAYALAERKKTQAMKLAQKANEENRRRSAGAVTGTEKDYFTPAEVRAMSRNEVRENYQKIMQSMQQWK